MRVDKRPSIRSRLAAIIETGPHKASGDVTVLGVNLPPRLRSRSRVGKVHVIRADVALCFIVLVDSPGGNRATRFSPHNGLGRELLVKTRHLGIAIVEALDINYRGEAASPAIVHGACDGARWIKPVRQPLHGANDPRAGSCAPVD